MNQKGMQGNIQTNETIPSICSKIGKYELQEISRTVTVKKILGPIPITCNA